MKGWKPPNVASEGTSEGEGEVGGDRGGAGCSALLRTDGLLQGTSGLVVHTADCSVCVT